MQRRFWLSLSVAFAVAIAACAQVAGLGAYEKVDCLDDCAEAGAGDVNVEPAVDGNVEAQPPSNCAGTSTRCNGACVELSTDVNNCGTCGASCGTAACCQGACANTTSSPMNCGACGVTCLSTEACTAGACRLLALGNGADGPLAITTDTTIDGVLTGALTIPAGTRVASVASTAGFAAGDLMLLHQTRGPGAGTYELGTVEKVDAVMSTITVARAVTHGYSSAGNARAQAVRIPEYTTVSVAAGATLTAPPWDGTSGGILVFEATGAVEVPGAVDMTGRGFRGFSHALACAGGARYACTTADTADGFAGESAAGPALVSNAANGSGGGGSQDGQDCGAGAGGGHGTAGTAGTNGAGGVCRAAPQLGGAAGTTAGVDDLSIALLFGGGAGGAIFVQATAAVSLGANLVTATGDGGGACTCGGMPGGSGGSGRIAVKGSVTGSTNPPFVAK